MGLRRLRGRLDQLQGNANETLQMAKDLIDDLKDGVGITIHLNAGAAKTLASMLLKGHAGDLPLTVTIDPTVDSK